MSLMRQLAGLLLAAVFSVSFASDSLVEKKSFEIASFTTVGDKIIKPLKIGYETWGTLNATGDNAILICHYFSGSSHAAGRYKPDDAKPGYWDAIIGPGKAIDTNKYFVVSADVIANLNKDTQTFTSGPASLDPYTGRPYGMRFPIVTIRDFVNAQHALARQLGVRKFAAVAGPSLGSMQALEWAAAYPEMVERVIAVIPPGLEFDPLTIARANLWAAPIRLDPKWSQGTYYGREEPTAGVRDAVKNSILDVLHWGLLGDTFGRNWTATDKNPGDKWDNVFASEEYIDNLAETTAAGVDANAFLYLVRAAQLFRVGQGATLDEGVKRIKAKVLIMPASSDLLFFPAYARRAAETLKRHGIRVEYAEIEGVGGHLDGLQKIGQMSGTIKAFLAP